MDNRSRLDLSIRLIMLVSALIALVVTQLGAGIKPIRIGGSYAGPLTPGEAAAATAQAQAGEEASAIVGGARSVVDLPPLLTTQSWRMGFGLAERANPFLYARALGAGWYLDWAARPQPKRYSPEHWQMVRVSESGARPSAEEAARLALRYPRQTWIIGNEMDVIWQDSTTPERYAEVYHEFYMAIKLVDPQARIAVGGISQATPLRLAYLDRVLQTYGERYGAPMPVDVWTVHGFVLREERGSWGVDIPPGFGEDVGRLYEIEEHGSLVFFEEHVRAFRRWMAANGYRHTPLAMTEFGILMPPVFGFPPQTVADYLTESFNLLATMTDPETGYPTDGNRLVQRWAWFSLSDGLYPSSNLADLARRELTLVGSAFRSFAETTRKQQGANGKP